MAIATAYPVHTAYIGRRVRAGEHEADMLGTTHAATGFLAGAGLGLLMHAGAHGTVAVWDGIGTDILMGLVTGGAALLPDADHPKASIARTMGFVTRGITHLVAVASGGHRQGMHSLAGVAFLSFLTALAVRLGGRLSLGILAFGLAVIIAAGLGATGFARRGPGAVLAGAVIAACAVYFIRADLWWLVALGMAIHIGQDMCTGHGVALLWPFSLARIGGDGRQPAKRRPRSEFQQRRRAATAGTRTRPRRRPADEDTRPGPQPARPRAAVPPDPDDPHGIFAAPPRAARRPKMSLAVCVSCLTLACQHCTDDRCQCAREAEHKARPGYVPPNTVPSEVLDNPPF